MFNVSSLILLTKVALSSILSVVKYAIGAILQKEPSKMTINVLENFHIFFFWQKSIFFKLKISTHIIRSAITIPRLERYSLYGYSVYSILFLICSKVATDLLRKFHIFIGPKSTVLRLKISTHKISLAIPLPRLERALSRLPFAYSLYDVLFLTYSKMGTDLL